MTSCEKDILRTFVENHGLAGTLEELADIAKKMANEIKGSTDEKETILWNLAAGEIGNCTRKIRTLGK